MSLQTQTPSALQREFGFRLEGRSIIVDDLRVRASGRHIELPDAGAASPPPGPLPPPAATSSAYFEVGGRQPTPAYTLSHLRPGHAVPGEQLCAVVAGRLLPAPVAALALSASNCAICSLNTAPLNTADPSSMLPQAPPS